MLSSKHPVEITISTSKHGNRQRDQGPTRPHHWRLRRVRLNPRNILQTERSLIGECSIGAACARDLLANGASLALTYSTNKASLDQLLADLQPQAEGRTISSHQCDVGRERDLQQLFDEIKQQHGQHPDILVVNAGYGKRTSNILEIDIEEWDYTINVNLRSSFIITKLAVPHMLEQSWGRVVYISSIAAGGTSINGCHYSASKGTYSQVVTRCNTDMANHSRRPRLVEELGQQDGQKRHHL